MKRRLYFISIALLLGLKSYSQIGIGTITPHNSSILEINASDKGVLIPRVALSSTDEAGPITSPLPSLLIYNTENAGTGDTKVTPGYYYWDSERWVKFTDSNDQVENGVYVSGTSITSTLSSDTTVAVGDHNVYLGNFAGNHNTKPHTVFIGEQSGLSNEGTQTIGIGRYAGYETKSDYNIGIGYSAAYLSKTPYSTALGYNAGTQTEANDGGLVAVGYFAAANAKIGEECIAIGSQALFNKKNKSSNVIAIGRDAGRDDETVGTGPKSDANAIYIGKQAGLGNSGENVIAMGYNAGWNNKGNHNLFFGQFASPQMLTGNNNLLLGSNTTVQSLTESRQFNIINRIVSDSDGNIGINTLSPRKKLHVDAANDSLFFDKLSGQGNILAIDNIGNVYRTTPNTITTITTSSTNEVINLPSSSNMFFINNNHNVTLSLPNRPMGTKVMVKKISASSNQIIINGGTATGITIDGELSKSLNAQWQSLVFLSDGSNWFIYSQI